MFLLKLMLVSIAIRIKEFLLALLLARRLLHINLVVFTVITVLFKFLEIFQRVRASGTSVWIVV